MQLQQGYSRLCHSVEQCRKVIKEQIYKYKKRARCNWPELHLYCGVCDLKTGLYIRSVFSLLINLTILIINVIMLYYILNTGTHLYAMEMSDIEEYLADNITEMNFDGIKHILKLVVMFIVMWIIFKTVYIFTVFLTMYAMYQKKPKMLTFVLYVNVLNWILDVFISIFGIVLTKIMPKSLVIICLSFEGYNLMAISSASKQLRGKSKLLLNVNKTHSSTDATITTMTSVISTDSPQIEVSMNTSLGNEQHCQTCNTERCLANSTEASSNSLTELNSCTNHSLLRVYTEYEEKEMNIKDIDIIFNQNQLLPRHNPVLENVQSESIVRPQNFQRFTRLKTLDLFPDKEKKVDITDIPIIYDESQLQVGGSPVIEDKQDNQLIQ